MVRLLQDGLLDGLAHTLRVTNSSIEEGDRTVIRTTSNDFGGLGVESQAAQGRQRLEGLLWEVGVSQVPDIRISRHVLGLLLESEGSVSYTHSQLRSLVWLPNDLGGSSLDLVGVLEDHLGLHGDILRHMLGLFTSEVLFEEVDLVVLEDAFGGALGHTLGSLRETEGGLSVHLLLVLGNLSRLGGVVFDGPTSLLVFHTLGSSWNSFSVNL